MKAIIITFIVPVYRTDFEQLEICLSSISKQTIKSFEIIVVDDGNQPEYFEKLKNLCSKYYVDRLVHIEHAGLAAARNAGIRIMKGEAAIFVDADDYISKWMGEDLWNALVTTSLDVGFGYIKPVYNSNLQLKKENITIHKYQYLMDNELMKLVLCGLSKSQEKKGYISCGPCCAIYSKNILNHYLFPEELDVFEDVLWNIRIAWYVKKVVIVPETLYAYRQNQGSITRSWNDLVMAKRIRSLKAIYKEIMKLNPTLKEWYALRVLANYSSICDNIMYSAEEISKIEQIKMAIKIWKDPVWNVVRIRKIDRNWEVKFRVKRVVAILRLLPLFYLIKNLYKA